MKPALLKFCAILHAAQAQVLKTTDDWKGTPSVSGSFTPPKNKVASERIGSREDWDKLRALNRPLVVGFFTDWKEGNGQTFLQTAVDVATNHYIEYRFGHCLDADMVAEHGDGNVIIFLPADKATEHEAQTVRLVDENEWTIDSIKKFIKENAYGKVPEATSISFSDMQYPLAVVVDQNMNPTNPDIIKKTREALFKIQKEFDGKMNFAVAHLNPRFEKDSGLFPLTTSTKIDRNEAFAVIVESKKAHSVMEGVFDPEKSDFRDFVAKFIASKEAPEEAEEGEEIHLKDEL